MNIEESLQQQAVIARVRGREVIDSRGNPTVEADVILSNGVYGRAAVPSGASTGSLEAHELRDGDQSRFGGRGVTQAVAHINGEIARALVGKNANEQRLLDECMIELDGSDNKRRLGANAILAVSLAAAKASARLQSKPLHMYLRGGAPACLPVPMINILNGGVHARNGPDIQEFMIVPVAADSMAAAVRAAAEIFHALAQSLRAKNYPTTVGDEGGFAPALASNDEALQLLMAAIEAAGYVAGQSVFLALDVASTEIYKDGHYHFATEQRRETTATLIDRYERWIEDYPIVSIEDGLAEDDWDGWIEMTARLGQRVQLVGDDLFVTNTKLIQRGIECRAANAVLIKLNQIGTVSETLDAIATARAASYNSIISHRSGETEDVSIADLAVATGVQQIKTGSLSRSDRVAKYNQLLRIEEAADGRLAYAGRAAFSRFLDNKDR